MVAAMENPKPSDWQPGMRHPGLRRPVFLEEGAAPVAGFSTLAQIGASVIVSPQCGLGNPAGV